MKEHLKNYFVPHEHNNYHPHILHTKRALLYSGVFVAMKAIMVSFALLIPSTAFLIPDVLADQHRQLISLTNQLRKEKGLSILSEQALLHSSSQLKVQDMKAYEYFSHTSPEHKTLSTFLSGVGYDYLNAGENLAMGFVDARELMDAWKKSPTHYNNLIDPGFKEFGIATEAGKYAGEPTVYVAQHFGTPRVRVAEEREQPIAIASDPPAESAEIQKMEIATTQKEQGIYQTPPEEIFSQTVAEQETTKKQEELRVEERQPAQGVSAKQEIPEQAAPLSVTRPPTTLVVAKDNSTLQFHEDSSRVFWKSLKDEKGTSFVVKAYIDGQVKLASVSIQEYSIPLTYSGIGNLYEGRRTVDAPPEDFFRVVIQPTITIVGEKEKSIETTITWHEVLLVSDTPFEHYTKAKNSLSGITSLFDISKGIYMFFIVFFSIVLAMNIFIEVRKQHHHVIAQTLMMIGLLVTLYWV